MTKYMIGYDLNRPGQNYDKLTEAIKGVGSNWWHCLDSSWIVISNLTAVQIRDTLAPHIDKNDELLVAALTSESAWQGFDTDCSSWLKNNM